MTLEHVSKKLKTEKWLLVSLPSMYAKNFYLFFNNGHYHRIDFNKKYNSVSTYEQYTERAFKRLYNRVTEKYAFEDRHFAPFYKLPIENIQAVLSKADVILSKLSLQPATIMKNWVVSKDKYLSYFASTVTRKGQPYHSVFSFNRVKGELLTSIIQKQAEPGQKLLEIHRLAGGTIAEFFEPGYPQKELMMVTRFEAESIEGYIKNERGFFVRVTLDKEQQLLQYFKVPSHKFYEHFCDRIFKQKEPIRKTITLSQELIQKIHQCENLEYIIELNRQGDCNFEMGEYRSNQWVRHEQGLISPVTGETADLKSTAIDCIENDFFYSVTFKKPQPVQTLTEEEHRITFEVKHKLAGLFSKEERFLQAVKSAFETAVGIELGNQKVVLKDHKRTISLVGAGYRLQVNCTAIESGMGIHGEHCSYYFNGLPHGLGLSAYSSLNMRSGGKITLEVFTSDRQLFSDIKKAFLFQLNK